MTDRGIHDAAGRIFGKIFGAGERARAKPARLLREILIRPVVGKVVGVDGAATRTAFVAVDLSRCIQKDGAALLRREEAEAVMRLAASPGRVSEIRAALAVAEGAL